MRKRMLQSHAFSAHCERSSAPRFEPEESGLGLSRLAVAGRDRLARDDSRGAAGAAADSSLAALERIGRRRVWIAGLLLVAAGSAARGAGPSEAMLFAMTFVMGLGVAVCQPSAPTIVGEWFPRSIGFATAVYVNGLLVGETLSAALTIPYVLPLLRDNWELSLVFWSLPAWLAVALFALIGHRERPPANGAVRWMPDWRDGVMWRLGIIFAGASISYWSANAFIPDYLRETGHAGLIEPSLSVLNAAQL